MSDFNKVIVIGRLTKDVETTFTTNGTQVSKFGMATSNGFGENKKTVFFDVTIWGKQAKFASDYFKKGNECLIEGRLDFDSWESKEGDKRSKLYVTAEKISFSGGKKEGGEEPKKEVKKTENQPTENDEDIPF